MTTTITPVAPSYKQRYGHERGEVPVKKEIKAKDNGRPMRAGPIKVRVLVCRKKDNTSSVTTQHTYRLLVVHDEKSRQYPVPWDIGPVSERLAASHVGNRIQGLLPEPGAWEARNVQKFINDAVLAGFEPYDSPQLDSNAFIEHTVKESV